MLFIAGTGSLMAHLIGCYAFGKATSRIVEWRGTGRARPLIMSSWGMLAGILLAHVHG